MQNIKNDHSYFLIKCKTDYYTNKCAKTMSKVIITHVA